MTRLGNMMKAVIMAGGAGTRLKSISGTTPKPMVPIAGKPILEHQIENLRKSSICDIVLVMGQNHKIFEDYFRDGKAFGVSISYYIEEEPLGTAGALGRIPGLDDDFIMLCGDLILDIAWDKFAAFHKAKGGLITAFTHPNDHPFDSDVLYVDADDRITAISKKNEPRSVPYPNLTNAGLYVVSPELIKKTRFEGKMDFERDLLLPNLDRSYSYRSSEYVKDCGTPERYEQVEKDIKSGIIHAKSLSNVQKCIFLDRDGVLNVFGDFVTNMDKLKVRDEAPSAVKRINQSEYLAIVITNQPVVARGETTLEELRRIHMKLEDGLGDGGAYLNDLYFCPHHPDKGFKGERGDLKIDCDCRKPKPGLFYRARDRYNIDLKQSWMIGDMLQDVQAGINAGCRTILLTCGDPRPDRKCPDAKPDYVCNSLNEALDIILGK